MATNQLNENAVNCVQAGIGGNGKSFETESVRERIKLSAGPIFADKGFRATTVREICQAANVNLASINYHFGDKERLYYETVLLARKMRADQVPNPVWTPEVSAAIRLQSFIEMMLERLVAMETEPWQVRLLMREVLQPTAACRQLVESYFRPTFETLLSIVDDLSPMKLTADHRIRVGFSIVGQCLFYRHSSEIAAMMIGFQQEAENQELDRKTDQESSNDIFNRQQLAAHISAFSIAAIQQANVSERHHTNLS